MNKPERETLGIVLVGSFNPKIFHPAWFSSEGLIRKAEAQEAKVEVVHPEFTAFDLDWLKVRVTTERLSAETDFGDSGELLRDLVLSTFQLLRHTPLRQMGINRASHFGIASREEWHSIGHMLAPKEPWSMLNEPGLLNLGMYSKRQDTYKGSIQVHVRPSVAIDPGVFVLVNDHYEAEKADDKPHGAVQLCAILNECWAESQKRSQEIMWALLEYCKQHQNRK